VLSPHLPAPRQKGDLFADVEGSHWFRGVAVVIIIVIMTIKWYSLGSIRGYMKGVLCVYIEGGCIKKITSTNECVSC